MDRPTNFPSWATNDVDEVIVLDDAPVILANKLDPTTDFRNSGLLYRQNLPRPFFNGHLNLIDQWIQNFDERTSRVGNIYLTTDNTETVSTIALRFGGTWTARGTDALGTSGTIYVFERTA